MLLLPLLFTSGEHHGGNAPAEMILVSLVLLVLWGVYRISSRKSS